MHLFRRTWTGPDGLGRTARRWSVEFTDHRGARRRLTLFEDRGYSATWAERLARLVDLRRAGRALPSSLRTWLCNADPSLVAKLIQWRLVVDRVVVEALLASDDLSSEQRERVLAIVREVRRG